ncbi:transposase [Nguyenibacter vanlangensis]|uniref:Transposase n=1 Tax=Nguyenibacter vanlangensis TaxID=1216886 RepID=A0ABZ3D0N4_9PROT
MEKMTQADADSKIQIPGQAITIGIDISKVHLDVALYPGGETWRFLNARSGHTALLRWLGKQVVARIVFEATGPYHRDLERRLEQAGLPFAKVNPRQARRFAEATGKLAKIAITAIMRRLVVIANALLRDDRTWNPKVA